MEGKRREEEEEEEEDANDVISYHFKQKTSSGSVPNIVTATCKEKPLKNGVLLKRAGSLHHWWRRRDKDPPAASLPVRDDFITSSLTATISVIDCDNDDFRLKTLDDFFHLTPSKSTTTTTARASISDEDDRDSTGSYEKYFTRPPRGWQRNFVHDGQTDYYFSSAIDEKQKDKNVSKSVLSNQIGTSKPPSPISITDDGRTDGRTDERTDGRMDERTDGRTDERTDGRMDDPEWVGRTGFRGRRNSPAKRRHKIVNSANRTRKMKY